MALLHIKLAQVLHAGDGIGDALLQVGGAQADPLFGKLGAIIQQRGKIARKGSLAAVGPGAHDAIHGNIHQAHVDGARGGLALQDLVQNRGIGILALGHGAGIKLFARPQRRIILFNGF